MRLVARAFAIGLTLGALAAPAVAAEFDAAIGKTGTGRCHMDNCSFFSIQTAIPVATVKDGSLFTISELSWSSDYKPRDDGDEYAQPPLHTSPKTPDAYLVFCSKTRPMMFFLDGPKWTGFALRPGDEQAIAGATESAYSSYWAACHHFIAKDVYSTAKLAAKLGYHFSGGYPNGDDGETGPIKEPRDLLK